MPDVSGANAYFINTTRHDQWTKTDPVNQLPAILEAAAMMSRLPFARKPPQTALDAATYEQALCLLTAQNVSTDTSQAILSGVTSRSLDGASESYIKAADMPNFIGGMMLCPHALSWIMQYLNRGGARSGRIVCR